MAKLNPLDPAPKVEIGNVELVALEAGRTTKGLTVSIEVLNGTGVFEDVVHVKVARARESFANKVSEIIGVPVDVIDTKVRELGTQVEVCLRNRAAAKSKGVSSLLKKQADVLIALAEHADLFHDAHDEGFATVEVGNHSETWPIRSRNFKLWLKGMYFRESRSAPNAQALNDALGILESRALFDGPGEDVHVRVAGDEEEIYIDRSDDAWEAVKVTHEGHLVVSEPPLKFIRARGMVELPRPTGGGSLDDLRNLLNLGDDDSWRLVVVWMVMALRPRGPYPLLALHGEQGSAKSTVARILRTMVDPSSAPLRGEPREVRDLMIAARNSWLICFDNLSKIPGWLSDGLCRLATGGGWATRELYTDRDEILLESMRPIVLNGISELATRGDLLERSIVLQLPRISKKRRRREDDIWSEYDTARASIFGALLETVSGAMRELPGVKLDEHPRMADFAAVGVAVERALNWPPGSFLDAYGRNQEAANAITIEASPVGPAVIELIENVGEWKGTMTKLLRELDLYNRDVDGGRADAFRRGWPQTPEALGKALRNLAPNLRRTGIEIEFSREGAQRTIALRHPDHEREEVEGAECESKEIASDSRRLKE